MPTVEIEYHCKVCELLDGIASAVHVDDDDEVDYAVVVTNAALLVALIVEHAKDMQGRDAAASIVKKFTNVIFPAMRDAVGLSDISPGPGRARLH